MNGKGGIPMEQCDRLKHQSKEFRTPETFMFGLIKRRKVETLLSLIPPDID